MKKSLWLVLATVAGSGSSYAQPPKDNNKLSDFEQMLAGFPNCQFDDIDFTKDISRSVDETYYGLKIYKITRDTVYKGTGDNATYNTVSLYIDAPLAKVREVLAPHSPDGFFDYNKKFPTTTPRPTLNKARTIDGERVYDSNLGADTYYVPEKTHLPCQIHVPHYRNADCLNFSRGYINRVSEYPHNQTPDTGYSAAYDLNENGSPEYFDYLNILTI